MFFITLQLEIRLKNAVSNSSLQLVPGRARPCSCLCNLPSHISSPKAYYSFYFRAHLKCAGQVPGLEILLTPQPRLRTGFFSTLQFGEEDRVCVRGSCSRWRIAFTTNLTILLTVTRCFLQDCCFRLVRFDDKGIQPGMAAWPMRTRYTNKLKKLTPNWKNADLKNTRVGRES
jgi:hypothetical protein